MTEGVFRRIVVIRNASGRTGLSAYQQAVKDGYTGTEQEYAAYPLQSGADAVAAAAEARVARDQAYASSAAADASTAAAYAARDAANTATTQANTARDGANAAKAAADTATAAANTATTQANTARDNANTATTAANTATTQANTARDNANNAAIAANTTTAAAVASANTARDAANTAATAATTAAGQATTATTAAQTATTQANTARDAANTAAAYVNDLLTQQIGQTWVNYSSARVLTAADNGKLIAMTSTGINFIYADAGLPADFRCEVMRLTGAGEVIVAGGVGATVTGASGQTAMSTVNVSGILRNVVQDQLVLSGGTAPPSTIALNRPDFSKAGASGQSLAFLF